MLLALTYLACCHLLSSLHVSFRTLDVYGRNFKTLVPSPLGRCCYVLWYLVHIYLGSSVGRNKKCKYLWYDSAVLYPLIGTSSSGAPVCVPFVFDPSGTSAVSTSSSAGPCFILLLGGAVNGVASSVSYAVLLLIWTRGVEAIVFVLEVLCQNCVAYWLALV